MDEKRGVTIPMALQVVVDDVGWWSGRDGSRYNQPFRTALGRDHLPQDYDALVRLGKKLAMKILAGFVLCEWDRAGILKNLPSATWMGRDWAVDWVDPALMEQAGEIINQAGAHLEIALHGVGHEFWTGRTMHRAEFHDPCSRMRDRDEIRRHLEFFFRIMDQHGFSPRPTAFIPPAMKHSFGSGDKGIQKLLNGAGIRLVTACFQKARHLSPPRYPTVTWESGVVVLDRGPGEVPWNAVAPTPLFGFDRPLLVLHWANLLHRDPDQNPPIVDAWVDFIQKGAQQHGVLLATDTEACITQYLYRTCSKVRRRTHSEVCIDLSWRRTLPFNCFNGPFAVRVTPPGPFRFRVAGARVVPPEQAALRGASVNGPGGGAALIFLFPEADRIYLKFSPGP